MKLNDWWTSNPEERFWLEITDRADLGQDLNAPQEKEGGKPYWGYSLIVAAKQGDIAFHYYKPDHAIVAWSVIAGEAWEDTVVWGAHGASARGSGVEPYARPGWRRGIDQFARLPEPVSLEELRGLEPAIKGIRDALEAQHAGSLYLPFEFSDKRPMRPSQPYFSKLPADLVRLFPQLEAAITPPAARRPAPGSPGPAGLGAGYREADENAAVSQADPFQSDPALIERALRGHRGTQNALARYLSEHGIEPRSPAAGEPNYDLAWEHLGRTFVAEVKSTTDVNAEKQLRLGLGQVLRYADHYERGATPVLVAEHAPTDKTWYRTCARVGVILTDPASFPALLSTMREGVELPMKP